MRLRSAKRRNAGFTLIEILIVVAIISILAAILIATFLRARAQATVAASKGNIRNIGVALELYFTENDAYPDESTWQANLTGGGYVRAIPDDPCTNSSYVYDASMGGSPPSDFKLSVTYPLTSSCRLIVPGLSYTPAGGLAEEP